MQTILLSPQTEISLEPKADCSYVIVPKNSVHIQIRFKKPGVTCQLIALCSLFSREKIELQTESLHECTNTECFTKVAAALAIESQFSYKGLIRIEERAVDTTSFLEQKDLILDEKAISQSQPILEIHNNQVQASHSSSSGRLRAEDLFYLMSRGFSEEEAKISLQEAFFAALLQEIPDVKIREKVAQLVLRKVNHV
jgi:Fe-S cluster assembly scaffold protein SufB